MVRKNLYFICPTDNLESIIDNRFKGHNYFYTSLGNTLCIDETSLKQIAELIQKKEITEISFVLSEDNSITLDALSSQNFSKIRGLKEPYKKFNNHKKNVMDSWKTYNYHTLILSYHLNQKIRELETGLFKYLSIQLKINGCLYSKSYNSFRQIYPDLVCLNYNFLN